MTREIPLTRGLVALVDDADYGELSRYSWHAAWGEYPYPRRKEIGEDGKQKTILMHRQILGLLGAPREIYGDHISGDVLDNRRRNLRLSDNRLNQANRRPTRGGAARVPTSRYKGVYLHPDGKWHARIGVKRRLVRLGTFETEIEAALAYDRAAIEMWGPHARLNLPEMATLELEEIA